MLNPSDCKWCDKESRPIEFLHMESGAIFTRMVCTICLNGWPAMEATHA